jgi:hypothetical protein
MRVAVTRGKKHHRHTQLVTVGVSAFHPFQTFSQCRISTHSGHIGAVAHMLYVADPSKLSRKIAMRTSMLFVLLSLGCAPSQFQSVNQPETALTTKSSETRTVAFELREGERLIGQPVVTVRLGTAASVAVAGDGGYKLDFTVEQHDPGARYLVRSSLYRPAGDGWVLVATPSMTVAQGQQTSMVINRTPAPIGIAVSVR